MNILTEKEQQKIKSKSIYWDEVANRDDPGDILHSELIEIVRILHTKILWILSDYVK